MALDLTLNIQNYENKDSLDSNNKPVTYLDAIGTALNFLVPGETPEQKSKVFQLSLKLYSNPKEVNLTIDDCTLIKEKSAKSWNALIYGRICQKLDEVIK